MKHDDNIFATFHRVIVHALRQLPSSLAGLAIAAAWELINW